MDSVTCDRTEAVYDLKGDARLPIKKRGNKECDCGGSDKVCEECGKCGECGGGKYNFTRRNKINNENTKKNYGVL